MAKDRLAQAAFYNPLPTPENPVWSLKEYPSSGVDKMQVPKKYHDVIDLCRFFYEHDGLAYNTINKQVEIGINGYDVNPKSCTDNELLVYEHVNRVIERFLRRAAREFLISGLVVPEVTWGYVPGTRIDSKLRKQYLLPVDIWIRDPASISLRKTPLPNHVVAVVKISESDKHFIESGGEFLDGIKDRETYEQLVSEYPDFVRAVKDGKSVFKLNNPVIIRRNNHSGNVYPMPYLLPALELLMHKRNLLKMDYAIASRVISAIQLFKMGNDEYPLTEDDDSVIEDLKKQMRWRQIKGNHERLFQLFSNHTLDIEWITPDVKALLSESKYNIINEDILAALGIPRIVISGETKRSGTSNSKMAMLPPINTIEFMRRQLLKFPKNLYSEIKTKNNFTGIPEPYYPPIRLQDLSELMEIGRVFYESGVISRTGWAEMGNFDFDTEMQRMRIERDKMQELDLLEHPEMPYSPKPSKVGDEKQKDLNEGEQDAED
jgi:hypothetical protein